MSIEEEDGERLGEVVDGRERLTLSTGLLIAILPFGDPCETPPCDTRASARHTPDSVADSVTG